MNKKKDIMGQILSGNEEPGQGGSPRELDCLIYRNVSGETKDEAFQESFKESWKESRDNVSVEVWESTGKIRMRVSLGKNRQVSMKHIASIAVDAIVKELKKED